MQKKVLKVVAFLFLSAIMCFVIRLNLPTTINRYQDIQFANKIIAKIDKYKTTNGLPDSYDWKTLKRFGFKIDGDVWTPQYHRINNDTYELVFVEGFDGPYLLWTSSERKWKVDMPTIPGTVSDQ